MAKKKIELTIPSDLKEEPIIYFIGRDFKVLPNIIEASFSTSMGWAVLTVEGDDAEIERLIESLKERNVKVKIL
ncbi:MAG: NIL domain-containing protein [Candidatus Omnitrophota bacterium]